MPLASAVGIIVGKVNLPSASLQVKIRPAWSATVRVVSAVKLTTFPTPAPITAPFVSDQASVSAPSGAQGQQQVSVKVELSDNAEDFLQVTQERLAKKGYAIR